MNDVADRFAAVVNGFERRVANPVVRRLLRSRFHVLVSWALVLVSYEGRVSGRRYDTPVAYARHDRTIVAAAPTHATNWWRNFREPTACTLSVRGRPRVAVGEVVTEPRTRNALARVYAEQRRVLGSLLGLRDRSAATDSRPPEDVAVVRFEFESTPRDWRRGDGDGE